MLAMNFSLDLEEDAVGDIVFLDDNGAQIHSNNSISKPQIEHVNRNALGQSWNLSNTGSFNMRGIRIKNGIQDSPKKAVHDTMNVLHSVDELIFEGDIGSGSVGSVKRAVHKPTGEVMAIKCIDFNDRNARNQLMDEISIYLKLSHPFIVPFKGCCINHQTEQLLLALEFCPNGSLSHFVEKHGVWTELQCQKMSKQIVSALSYLEFNQIMHRDIKPQNILLDQALNAKLADFGIQRHLASTLGAKTQIGTMLYMSPQRLNGGRYSFPSDVWSLGLTVLYCVFGRYPYAAITNPNGNEFKKMSLLATHLAIVEGEVPKVPHMDKNGDAFTIEFKSFVAACLYKDSSKRWKASDLLMHPFLM